MLICTIIFLFQNGLNETRRDRILRTFVRNTYRYHLHEIYSTLRNEYTDWERGEPNSLAICEGLLALLSDGQVAAPLLRLALLHSAAGGRGYFVHFQPGDDRPSRRAEDLPYFLGAPISAGGNYTALDDSLSRLMLHYLANFVRRGWVFVAFQRLINFLHGIRWSNAFRDRVNHSVRYLSMAAHSHHGSFKALWTLRSFFVFGAQRISKNRACFGSKYFKNSLR